jgi:glycosyltransferase involved in cell wall biosynthesis
MTKLIIQIPCYNEEGTLGLTLQCLPRELDGIDVIEWLIIDDGSTDNTVAVALEHGVHHIVRFPKNQGLAAAFMAGLHACLRNGADIIVNTDADNQYEARDIPKLVAPILQGRAEIVIGSRPIEMIEHFSPVKKALQRLGSRVVRLVSRTNVEDAPSGFRAMSRRAAMRLNVFNHYTYTLETIIQAGQKNMAIESVPVRVNEDLRPSRLVKSIPSYIRRSVLTMFRILAIYQPLKTFLAASVATGCLALIPAMRFLYLWITGQGEGNIQSLIFSAILFQLSFGLFFAGVLAELVGVNRMLLEEVRWKITDLQTEVDEIKNEPAEKT